MSTKKSEQQYPDDPSKEEVFKLQAAKAAHIMATGGTRADIQREFGLGWRAAQRIIDSAECRDIVKTLVDEVIDQAKKSIRHQTSQLVPELIKTLKYNLKKRNINAVPHVLKILDFDKAQDGPNDTSITIVMPGQEAPKDITPKDEDDSEIQGITIE